MTPRRQIDQPRAATLPGRRRAALGLSVETPASHQTPRRKAKRHSKPHSKWLAVHALAVLAATAVGVMYLADLMRQPVAEAALAATVPLAPEVSAAMPSPELTPPTPLLRPAPDVVPALDDGLPPWRRYAAAAPAGAEHQPRLAIVIDDLGLNEAAARKVADLPRPITMAFLPYARNLPAQTLNARLKGQELLVHLPMEPASPGVDPGRNALLTDLPPAEIERRLEWNLSRFSGFVGVNNHMGSRFTADADAMTPVLRKLAGRGLLFLDSRTAYNSAGVRIAASLGMPYGARNVFLDNERNADAILTQLVKAEAMARGRGQAIAIGHPHAQTIAALRDWIPAARQRGIALVPLSSLVKVPPAVTVASR